MKIVYVRPYAGEEKIVVQTLSQHEVLFVDSVEALTDAQTSDVELLSVFVDTVVDESVLTRFPKLLYIATRSAGFDHIAVREAQARGIVVSRVPHYGSQTVAEYAFALMFALSRNAYQASLDMQANVSSLQLERYEGFDLGLKTLGVVGTGLIGQKVCAIGKSFGMRVIAFDLFPNDVITAMDIPYVSLETLLQTADVVTLHVPGRPETHHMINADTLALCKPGAYLINTSRGEVVDTRALTVALQKGQLRGAGLDVLEYEHELAREANLTDAEKNDAILMETLACNHTLMQMENVIVTPHIAFNTKEAKEEITTITLSNIEAGIAGTPKNIVTL